VAVVQSLFFERSAAAACRIELLHHFRLQLPAGSIETGRPAQRLIAYLAVENRSHTRDHIAGCLWPDSTQARATGSLRRVLCLLQADAPDLITRDGHTLALSADADVDLWRQRLLVERVVAGECTSADREQLGLLRGDLLPDWDDAWLTPVRDELRQLRLLCLEALSVAQLDEDKPHSALAIALYATRDEPLRESAHRLVVQAHIALGNHAAAAQHYAAYSSLLWRELRQLRLLCLEALSVAQLDEEKPHSALAIALYATRDEPLRESAHRLVVQAHIAMGNHAAAAQHYAAYSSLLWRELRLRPGLRMESLVRPLLSTRDVAN
jgi:DNA-binding SARP family transcriptional activator